MERTGLYRSALQRIASQSTGIMVPWHNVAQHTIPYHDTSQRNQSFHRDNLCAHVTYLTYTMYICRSHTGPTRVPSAVRTSSHALDVSRERHSFVGVERGPGARLFGMGYAWYRVDQGGTGVAVCCGLAGVLVTGRDGCCGCVCDREHTQIYACVLTASVGRCGCRREYGRVGRCGRTCHVVPCCKWEVVIQNQSKRLF